MEAWKESLAGARVGLPLQRGEDGEAEISDGVDDAAVKSHRERVCEGEENPRQTEAVVQSFQDEGSWSSRVVTLAILCVPALRVVFCPAVSWGEEIPR